MAIFLKNTRDKIGKAPGTLLHIGEKKIDDITIDLITYSKDKADFRNISDIDDLKSEIRPGNTNWINICGLHDVDKIGKIGEFFNIHPLTLEDILNTGIRPKFEEFDDSLFFILKMYTFNKEKRIILTEQISIILKKDIVITFQEKEGDVFGFIRDRIKNLKGKIRFMKADYLAYALADAIIDQYFVILESFADQSEIIEIRLLDNPTRKTLAEIYHIKRELILLRKTIWPVREIVSSIQRYEGDLIETSTDIYLRDLYEHTISIIDTVETLRDMVSGMIDLYISSVSNRMNEIMKVLTIFSAIFIPLTFIAGIYGMNFENMPELSWDYGYFGVLGIMLFVFISMLLFFRKKKWL